MGKCFYTKYSVLPWGAEAEIDSEADSNANLRLSRQANSFALDFRVNKDKKLKFGATKWF